MLAACDAAGIALVPLAAPTTPDDRLAAIGARARGLPLHGVRDRHHRRAQRRRRRGADRAREGLHRRARRARLRHLHARAGARRRRRGRRRRDRRLAARPRGRRGRRRRARTRPPRPARSSRRSPPGSSALGLRADMGVLLTLIAGLVVWIVLWAIGAKSFDAFLITLVMLIVAAAAHIDLADAPGQPGPRPPLLSGPRPAHPAVRRPCGSAALHGNLTPALRGVRRIAAHIRLLRRGSLISRSWAASGCLVAALAFGVAACGDDDSGSGGGSGGGGDKASVGQRLLVAAAAGRLAPADDGHGERHQAGARADRRQGRRHHRQVHVARRLDGAGRLVDS